MLKTYVGFVIQCRDMMTRKFSIYLLKDWNG